MYFFFYLYFIKGSYNIYSLLLLYILRTEIWWCLLCQAFTFCSVIFRKHRQFSSILLALRLPIRGVTSVHLHVGCWWRWWSAHLLPRIANEGTLETSKFPMSLKGRAGRSTDVATEAKVERGSGVSLLRVYVSVCVAVRWLDYLHIPCSIRTFATRYRKTLPLRKFGQIVLRENDGTLCNTFSCHRGLLILMLPFFDWFVRQ